MSDQWGGPRAIDVLTAASSYLEAVSGASGALEAALEVGYGPAA